MKKLIFASFLLVTTGLAAQADEPPQWMQQVFTGQELEAAWQEYQTVYRNPDAALDAKTKQLIALAVAAMPEEFWDRQVIDRGDDLLDALKRFRESS